MDQDSAAFDNAADLDLRGYGRTDEKAGVRDRQKPHKLLGSHRALHPSVTVCSAH